MRRVICSLPNASSLINGIAFRADRGQMVSEEVSDEVAKHFAGIKGYVVRPPFEAEAEPAPTASPDDQWAAFCAAINDRGPEPEAPAPAPAEGASEPPAETPAAPPPDAPPAAAAAPTPPDTSSSAAEGRGRGRARS